MDKSKEILKNELFSGHQPVVELLYARYSGMLFSYILQFTEDKKEAGSLLVDVFSRLTPRLPSAFDSHLSVYCWLQVETRKIILEHFRKRPKGHSRGNVIPAGGYDKAFYFSLLEEATPEHQWVFRQLFVLGRQKEELARESGKDPDHIARLLRESLLIIRKNLR